MRINGIKCDQCNNVHHLEEMNAACLPLDWFFLTKGTGRLLGVEKHFCCTECLIKWTSLQTVASRKIDTGGPVVALSNEEYVRRFGKRG